MPAGTIHVATARAVDEGAIHPRARRVHDGGDAGGPHSANVNIIVAARSRFFDHAAAVTGSTLGQAGLLVGALTIATTPGEVLRAICTTCRTRSGGSGAGRGTRWLAARWRALAGQHAGQARRWPAAWAPRMTARGLMHAGRAAVVSRSDHPRACSPASCRRRRGRRAAGAGRLPRGGRRRSADAAHGPCWRTSAAGRGRRDLMRRPMVLAGSTTWAPRVITGVDARVERAGIRASE